MDASEYVTELVPLTVVPLSVISNWEKQIDDHCVQGVISSCVYYGLGRDMTSKELKQYDVVITTYQANNLLIYRGLQADST